MFDYEAGIETGRKQGKDLCIDTHNIIFNNLLQERDAARDHVVTLIEMLHKAKGFVNVRSEGRHDTGALELYDELDVALAATSAAVADWVKE